MDKAYKYIAEDILEEYATSYSQVDAERLAKTLQDLAEEKVEKFMVKVEEGLSRYDKHYNLEKGSLLEWLYGICKEFKEG